MAVKCNEYSGATPQTRHPKNTSYSAVGMPSENWPKLRRRYIALVAVILLLCLALGIYLVTIQLTNKDNLNVLIPPNPEEPLPASPSHLYSFSKGAVCTDGPPCSAIGRDILARNGSAVDAAIAAMFCNGVVNMQSMGLGGGFLMTIYTHETKSSITLNARESAPLKSTPDMYKDDSKSKIGALAVAVPGELRGYWTAYKRFGKLPWKDLIEPSIAVCENGYNMSKAQWDSLFFNKNLKQDPLFREWFVDPKTGEYLRGNSLIKPKKLCETLRIIAENGGDYLYNGTLSKLLLQDLQEAGGIITQEDLDAYEAKWEEPIKIQLQSNDTLYTVQPPGGGVMLGFMLNILDGFNFTNNSISNINNTILTYHRITEAFKYAFAERTQLGDTAFVSDINDVIKNLTSPQYAEQIRQEINDYNTSVKPEHYGAVFYNQPDHGTAHISVLAPNGDAVSVTSTINLYFGASFSSKQTGIIPNSCMNDFSFPNFSNFFGLPGSPANYIAPGKRAMSSMSPSILVDQNGNVKIVIGASGGTKITTAIALVIMRYLWFGQNVKEAVDAPRFHHQIFPMEISYEYGILQQVIDGLEKLGHKTRRYKDRGSIICALVREAEKILANADYRKGGDVFGID